MGVYHYKNRAYHPGLMRFMQTDPIGHSGGINLYAYVGGDPVNYTDPWGLRRLYSSVGCIETYIVGYATVKVTGSHDTGYRKDPIFETSRIPGCSGTEPIIDDDDDGGSGGGDEQPKADEGEDCNKFLMATGNFLRRYGANQQRSGALVVLAGAAITFGGLMMPADGPVIESGGAAIAAAGAGAGLIGTGADVVGQFLQGMAFKDAHHAMGGLVQASIMETVGNVTSEILIEDGKAARATATAGAIMALTDHEHRMRSCD